MNELDRKRVSFLLHPAVDFVRPFHLVLVDLPSRRVTQ
jgi:hypothetical protein